ncbi:MAG TPA: VOC family protein [Chloroflexota bacterium]|nr:VOC family protein [Chloroflexota bacterium]
MPSIQIHHVAIPVFDLERAETFYREVLGIGRSAVPSYNPASIVFLDCGPTMIHLIRYADGVARPGRKGVHWAFEVVDLEAAHRRVVAAGCDLEVPTSARPDGSPYFFFYDPEGNRVELCHHEEESRSERARRGQESADQGTSSLAARLDAVQLALDDAEPDFIR